MPNSRSREIVTTPAKAAKAAKEGPHFSNCSDVSVGAPSALLCSRCEARPRLGTLNRCRECISASAAQDRNTRAAAETRVAAKNGDSERQAHGDSLDAQADAILARDEKLLRELAGHATALETCYRELLQPRNDPEYVRNLERRNEELNQQANVTDRVEHRVVGGKTEIVILPTKPRNTAQGREAAIRVGRLFEAPVRYVEDPHDATRFADRSQKTPPKHSFGREKRSLRNRGK